MLVVVIAPSSSGTEYFLLSAPDEKIAEHLFRESHQNLSSDLAFVSGNEADELIAQQFGCEALLCVY